MVLSTLTHTHAHIAICRVCQRNWQSYQISQKPLCDVTQETASKAIFHCSHFRGSILSVFHCAVLIPSSYVRTLKTSAQLSCYSRMFAIWTFLWIHTGFDTKTFDLSWLSALSVPIKTLADFKKHSVYARHFCLSQFSVRFVPSTHDRVNIPAPFSSNSLWPPSPSFRVISQTSTPELLAHTVYNM